MANTITTYHSRFIVATSAAKMPVKCWGRYAHVGVVELTSDRPYCGQLRDTRTQELHHYWSRQHVGSTDRCAVARTVAIAERYACRMAQKYLETMSDGYRSSAAERSGEEV